VLLVISGTTRNVNNATATVSAQVLLHSALVACLGMERILNLTPVGLVPLVPRIVVSFRMIPTPQEPQNARVLLIPQIMVNICSTVPTVSKKMITA
jgi:hypothetical protein